MSTVETLREIVRVPEERDYRDPELRVSPCSTEVRCGSSGTSGQPVAYGAFAQVKVTGDTPRSNVTFGGDPIHGESNACYTRSGSLPGYAWTGGVGAAGEANTCCVSHRVNRVTSSQPA